jgi:hypothetical protein
MENRAFTRLLKQLKRLTPSQKGKLESTLHQEGAMDIVSAAIEEPQRCPHCGFHSYQEWGVRSGLQRYRCNRCKRTYNALTGTPLARLRHKVRRRKDPPGDRAGLSGRAAPLQSAIHHHGEPADATRQCEKAEAL